MRWFIVFEVVSLVFRRWYFLNSLNSYLRGWMLLLTLFSWLIAGDRIAAAELNIRQNQLPVVLGQYLDHLEDPGSELSIEDIMQPTVQWQRSTQAIPTFGLSESAHWFGIILTGNPALYAELVLSLESPGLDRVDFYLVHGDEIVEHKTVGDTIAVTDLEIPYRFPVIPFELSETETQTRIFFRAHSQSGVEIPLTLTTMALLANDQQDELAFLGAFFAFFFLCFCVCVIFLYFLREKQFLGFALFFGGAIGYFLAQTGMGRIWIWGGFSEFNNRASYVSATILIASFCLLGQSLQLTARYKDSVDIVLRFLTYAMIPVALYFLIIPFAQISNENVSLMLYLGLLIALTVFVMTGITAFQGSRSAMYLFFTWALVLMSMSSFSLYKFNLIERSPIAPAISQTLFVFAAMMLLLSLVEFARSKNEEYAQARQETKAKGDFLRNVSREFLTPVHLILANSKRLLAAQSKKLDEPTRQHMNTVIKQSDHLHNLINDLLEMAELESDSFEPEFELVEMSHFLNEVRDMMLPSAMEKGLNLSTEFASANLLVQTDKSRLQHALMNILTNAIKFTDKGDIKIGYKAVYFRRRLGIEIFIRDTGRGMSEEFQQRMFQEFTKEVPGSEKEPEGTGLGMVIVKRMIEKLDGEISFESEKDLGSEFFIRLPLRESIG
ncbi:MAG: sensor histidine kinase [Proteobacteria bacterium]|nr:sensor histidine kinase [Pseudomonadota bacterium]